MSSFLKSNKDRELVFFDNSGVSHVHMLRYESVGLGLDTIDDCINLGGNFIHKVVEYLNDRFMDLPVFNEVNLFNPHRYSDNEDERDSKISQWSE